MRETDVPASRLSPSAHRSFRQLLASRSVPLHLRAVPYHSLLCRAPALSPPSAIVRSHQVSRHRWGNHCASCTPDARASGTRLCGGQDRFSSLCLPLPGERLPCFFDRRTLPARRGASKRSRLDDHGPVSDPRDRQSGRCGRAARSAFRVG
jgi:hypothetical protein